MISPISLAAPLVYLFGKSKETKLNVEVYTGACIHYNLTYGNGQLIGSVALKEGTGVVAINRTLNTLRFFFNDYTVAFDREFISSMDEALNIETFDNGGNEEAICNYVTKTFELLEGKYLYAERDQYRITDFKLELHTLKVKE